MVKRILTLLFLVPLVAFAQVESTFSLARFKSPSGNYIENYLKIYSTSIQFKKNEYGGVAYAIQVTQLLKKDTVIIDFKKYILKSADTSTSKILEHLYDQQRFVVENNQNYHLEIELIDLFAPQSKPVVIEKEVLVNWDENKIEFSDIELLEQYAKAQEDTKITKSGFNLYPLVEDFVANDMVKIAYYAELYNTLTVLDSNAKYLLVQSIENYDTGKLQGEYKRVKRNTATEVQPILNIWDVEDLPTGNYVLVLQVIDKNKNVLAEKRKRFQRLNLKNDIQLSDLHQQGYINTFVDKIPKDSLDEEIKMLFPIASELERNTIEHQLVRLTEQMKREFIYAFWKKQNKTDPEKARRDYLKRVRYAQSQFGTRMNKGYVTDRGRVYLQYGLPNSINDKPSSNNSYPYQVWHYYKAGKFNNKTFIFYSPNNIGNDYILLHSDMPGEVKDQNWQRTLRKRANGSSTEELQHQSWEQY